MHEFVPFSKIVWGNRFLFLTRSRHLGFTLFEDFSIWKVRFVFKLIFKATQFQKNTWIWHLSKNTIFHFSVKYKFGISAVPVAAGSIYGEILLFSTKNWSFLGLECNFKQVKTRGKIFWQSCTTPRRFYFLAQFHFTTSETQLDYYHQKVNVELPRELHNDLRLRMLRS